MKCLVTGAAGFIGSTLSDRLLELGHEVVGVDCFTDYYSLEIKKGNLGKALGSPGFRLIEADLVEADISGLLEGVDWVFHQAAQPGVRMSWGSSFDIYVRNNVLATQKLLEAVKGSGIRRLVNASSSSIYGDSVELPLRETARPQPVSPYGVTKLAAEHLCYLYHVNYGVPAVSLRYFTVYGPRQRPDMGFHKFIKSALNGEEIVIFGDGEQTRDFTYITDAVEANVRAAEADGVEGRVFNIGGGSRISVNAVLDILRRLVGELKIRHIEDQKGDVRHTMCDTSAAREAFGYSPKACIEEGLARETEWLKELPDSAE
jgi:nucleoside-diphosphate-sugar epimerase